jgi:hypothetical protein
LWRYDYTVSGSFPQGWFFDIYFDSTLYQNLTDASAPNADWDVFLVQPNPANIPPFDRGMFDAFALNNPSLSGTFSVSFVFLGLGTPGSQPFLIFDADFNPVETGLTSPFAQEIPEPSTAALTLTAIVTGAIFLRRKLELRR